MQKIDEILESKNINEVTRKQYRAKLLILSNEEIPTTLTFMTKQVAIKKFLEENYAKSTQVSYYATLMSVISVLMKEDEGKWGKHYKYYSDILDRKNKELKEDRSMKPKEQNAWLTREVLAGYKEKFIKESKELSKKEVLGKKEFTKLMGYTTASLYIMNPPRRNVDYQEMYVIKSMNKKTNYDNDGKNYLDLNANKMTFNIYKTASTYNRQEVNISPDLRGMIDRYLKHHPLLEWIIGGHAIPFLVTFEGEKYNDVNAITRILNKAFDGRNVGSSMLRNMYLTNKYHDCMMGLENDAKDMGTSLDVIRNFYLKDGGDNIV